ncbi:unnamed protein product [Lota lota]
MKTTTSEAFITLHDSPAAREQGAGTRRRRSFVASQAGCLGERRQALSRRLSSCQSGPRLTAPRTEKLEPHFQARRSPSRSTATGVMPPRARATHQKGLQNSVSPGPDSISAGLTDSVSPGPDSVSPALIRQPGADPSAQCDVQLVVTLKMSYQTLARRLH